MHLKTRLSQPILSKIVGFNIQPRHQPVENIRTRRLVSYPFILLSMIKQTYPLGHFKGKKPVETNR